MRPDPGREARLALAALQLLTRLPVPRSLPYDPDWLPRGAKYFPLVGILVGAIAAGTLLAASRVWPAPLAALLAVGIALVVTGAFHEDGLADTADSLGGWTREARLAIMKDSRIGTYGSAALILCLGLRAAALAAMPAQAAAAALVAAHAAGRLGPVLLMATKPYAGRLDLAKVRHGPEAPTPAEVAVAAAFGLAPLLLLEPGRIGPALAIGAAAASWIAIRICRALGGYTGDVLGATEAVFETAFLVGAAASWPAASA